MRAGYVNTTTFVHVLELCSGAGLKSNKNLVHLKGCAWIDIYLSMCVVEAASV